jgi:translation elongation factor P/translation initiation factor 5A
VKNVFTSLTRELVDDVELVEAEDVFELVDDEAFEADDVEADEFAEPDEAAKLDDRSETKVWMSV